MKKTDTALKFLKEQAKQNKDYGFSEHWQNLKALLGNICYELIVTIQSISEKGAFKESYNHTKEQWPGFIKGVGFDPLLTADHIIEKMNPFLNNDYIPPDDLYQIVTQLYDLHSVYNYFVLNKFEQQSITVYMFKLDDAAFSLCAHTASLLSTGLQSGLKKDADITRTKETHKTRQQKKGNIVRPAVIAELEELLREIPPDVISGMSENKALQTLEGRLEKVLGKNKGASLNNIKPIVRDYFKETDITAPWKVKPSKL
ncbi:hypothetical protein PITCH_A1390017 [uncultured Desulfobacterium sp.]|uniref:Uncharacterized protein n=1 Tax=uncultured Desulfobacterium sp. TaxID=201089 RepID=A0A445MSX5_9BACT|nr:hypothetical protein PITCH_A1390017 [uncultured Desulfobacterium sp.]